MGDYSKFNAENILTQVDKCIKELEELKIDSTNFDVKRHHSQVKSWRDLTHTYSFRIDNVYEELSIFDWWNNYLSISQLKQMKAFLKTAIKLGFKGYVCFKVGAVGCANGMWAHTEESANGYSPKGDAIYHSFVSNENYWDICEGERGWHNDELTLATIKKILKKIKKSVDKIIIM